MPAIFEIRTTINGKYYWRFKAINGEVVASAKFTKQKMDA